MKKFQPWKDAWKKNLEWNVLEISVIYVLLVMHKSLKRFKQQTKNSFCFMGSPTSLLWFLGVALFIDLWVLLIEWMHAYTKLAFDLLFDVVYFSKVWKGKEGWKCVDYHNCGRVFGEKGGGKTSKWIWSTMGTFSLGGRWPCAYFLFYSIQKYKTKTFLPPPLLQEHDTQL